MTPPVGPEDVTPVPTGGRASGQWDTVNTGEVRLAQALADRERKSNWWRVLGVAGAAVALVQFLNSSGPCDATWKFQTKDAAAAAESLNEKEHTSIREEIRDALGKVLIAIQNQKKGK